MGMDYLLISCFIIGLVAGFMSGMFGIGGGSIRTPLLILSGIPPLSAFAINLVVIPFSSLVGALTHRVNVDVRTGVYVVVGGSLGSFVGALLVGLVPRIVLAFLFLASSVVTVFGMYLNKIAPKVYGKINPTPRSIIFGAFILNLITGMRGGSGGSLFPPFLRMMKLDIRKAIATSLFSTIFTATVAILVYWYRGNILWVPAILTIIGSMLGARIGGKVSLRTKPKWLQMLLAILILALAIVSALKIMRTV